MAGEDYVSNEQRQLDFKTIYVKAKIKLKKVNDNYLFGEESIVKPMEKPPIKTVDYNFEDYTVAAIE